MNENPIDKDDITENPHSIEYPHHRGSQLVKPEDVGKTKGRAISAMEHQTDQQLDLIRDQMALLAEQAKRIQMRKEVSEDIYRAEMRFEPLINHHYHLYRKDNGNSILSMISPDSWGRSGCPFTFIASVKLLADHTWEVLKTAED